MPFFTFVEMTLLNLELFNSKQFLPVRFAFLMSYIVERVKHLVTS